MSHWKFSFYNFLITPLEENFFANINLTKNPPISVLHIWRLFQSQQCIIKNIAINESNYNICRLLMYNFFIPVIFTYSCYEDWLAICKWMAIDNNLQYDS